MTLLLSLLLQAAASPAVAAPVEAQTPPEDQRIVCRSVTGTGSRLNVQRLCMSKKEWRRMHEQGREAASSIQDTYSKRPPANQ